MPTHRSATITSFAPDRQLTEITRRSRRTRLRQARRGSQPEVSAPVKPRRAPHRGPSIPSIDARRRAPWWAQELAARQLTTKPVQCLTSETSGDVLKAKRQNAQKLKSARFFCSIRVCSETGCTLLNRRSRSLRPRAGTQCCGRHLANIRGVCIIEQQAGVHPRNVRI